MSETITLYKCDKCGKVILKPEDGLVIHGNIYVADPETIGGLVGDNFPKGEEGKFENVSDAVKKSVFCVPCFLKVVLPNTKLSAVRDF